MAVLDPDFVNIFFKPIAPYLNDPDTTEIMVNAYDDIWVEDSKGLYKIPDAFSPDGLDASVKALAQYVGRPLRDDVYAIDARLPDRSRICIMLPPVSGDSPAFAIRIFKKVINDLNVLIKNGTLTEEMVRLISSLVQIKKNIMISGGTSSGKTTLLNLVSATIPNEERILTIEDSRELQLKQDHVLSLEGKAADKNGNGAFAIRDCLKSSLRLRPDRIIVGEIRGGEAFDLIQAMNTGHDGCMGTVHANNALETLKRIESIALMSDVEISLTALRSMIAASIDVIICPSRMIDGSRKIVQIAEVGPLTESGEYQVNDIVRYIAESYDPKEKKLTGHFEFTGYIPSFVDGFLSSGVNLQRDFFKKRVIGITAGAGAATIASNNVEAAEPLITEEPQSEKVVDSISTEQHSPMLDDLSDTTPPEGKPVEESIQEVPEVKAIEEEAPAEEKVAPAIENEISEEENRQLFSEVKEQIQKAREEQAINNTVENTEQATPATTDEVKPSLLNKLRQISEQHKENSETVSHEHTAPAEPAAPIVENSNTEAPADNQDFFTLDDLEGVDIPTDPAISSQEKAEPAISETTTSPAENNIEDLNEQVEPFIPAINTHESSDNNELFTLEDLEKINSTSSETIEQEVAEPIQAEEIISEPARVEESNIEGEAPAAPIFESAIPEESEAIDEQVEESIIKPVQVNEEPAAVSPPSDNPIHQAREEQSNTISSIIKKMRARRQEGE